MYGEHAPKPKKKPEAAPEGSQLEGVLEALKTKAARARALKKYGIKQPDNEVSGG